jgi:CRISPR-associated endonuclease Cas2
MTKGFLKGERVSIEGVVLSVLATGGLLTLAVLAPNALQLLKYLDKKKRKKNPKYLIAHAVDRLVSRGLIEKGRNGKVHLTEKGKRELHRIEYGIYPFPKKKWDGKWRIVTFDIAEKRKYSRDRLRLLLQRIGFVRIQDSVWVYPYDMEELITLVQSKEYLEKEVMYLVSEIQQNEEELKKHFQL